MTIKLNKGGKINLTKEAPSLSLVAVGLGWDLSHIRAQFDLDASVFLLDNTGRIPSEEFFIFYNNLSSPDNSTHHKGDNRTGRGEGDDELIVVELSKVRPDVTEILFVATIHEAHLRRQNFGMVKNAYIRIYDYETNREIAKYDLDELFSNENAVEFGKLYRDGKDWRFVALGAGYGEGLQGLVDKYVC